jgi:hypothetical protein
MLILPDNSYTTLYCRLDYEEDHIFMRGEKIHIELSEEDIQRYTARYGEGIFTRIEADVELEQISYLPVGDDAKMVFEYLDESCLGNVDSAAKSMMDHATKTETTAERVGIMFFYDNEGVLNTDNDDKFYNQIVFIYKFTSEEHPEAWYSYMAFNGYVAIGWGIDPATIEYTKGVCDLYGNCLTSDFRYYHNEHPKMHGGPYPSTFEHNGVQYPGHLALTDVFSAIMENMYNIDEYDHLIVTDEIKEYVKEY